MKKTEHESVGKNSWHAMPVVDVLSALSSHERGLSGDEAKKRLEKYGSNKLPEGRVDGIPTIFFRQFKSVLIYILLIAAGIVFLMEEPIDAAIILFVLLFNAIVGTIQEGKAQNTLRALKNFAETSATVLRDEKEIVITDEEVVQGDIILLEEGEKVPADARIIFANTLKIDEASLTGESEPAVKNDVVSADEKLPLTDRKNMLWKGTHVVSGSGVAIVVATGHRTEIGKIAQKISNIDTEIPLKANIRYLSQMIVIAVFIINIVLIILGLFRGNSLSEMFRTAVALSVSIIPEGLPIVMTLVLATGVWRMSKRNALVKKLQAVEALGQTQIIAVDKTGTLTRNEMVIEKVYVDEKVFDVTGAGYEPKGEFAFRGGIIDPLEHADLILAGKISAFCAKAHLSFVEETGAWKISGDPTEAAMLVFAEKIGFKQETLQKEEPLLFELPFDFHKKYHTTIRKSEGKNFLVVAGAPENVLALCKTFWSAGKKEPITAENLKEIEARIHEFAGSGYRVVAFSIHEDSAPVVETEHMPPLTFVGLFGMKDALRTEVKESVERVHAAGMKVVMITGDHRVTARAVAEEAGIYREGDSVLSGEEIDKMSDAELSEKLSAVTVFARVTPAHKLRIIEGYKARGEVVAMTGDGINDAPSLMAADLGVAMGKIGTEVAKEAADIVLLDDNFGSIVSTAEEGRGIYKTIKKVILYLFSTNVGEVLAIMGAMVLGIAMPLLPAQIIWLNFVTDGFLDVSLAMEPHRKSLLRGKFVKPKKWIVDGHMALRMFLMAAPMAIGTLFLFDQYYAEGSLRAWSVSLTALAVFQWFNAWNCRSEERSIFQMHPFSNKYLVGATIIVILLQFLALYTPFFQYLLRTYPLTLSDWLFIIPIASSIIVVEEIRKFFYRKKLIKTEN